MRVGIFTDNDFDKVNGVTTTLRAVVAHAPRDVRVRVYTSGPMAVDSDAYLSLRAPGVGIPFYREMTMYVPRFRAFLRAARRDGVDLVHYTTPGPMGLVAQYVAATLQVPMVGSFHTQLAEYTALLSGSEWLAHAMRQYLRWPYGRCARVLVPSRSTRDLLVRARIAPGKLAVWSRGVDVAHFDPSRRSNALRRRWGADEHTPVVAYVGRVSAEKGLCQLPDVWQQLAPRERARLVVVGDGPLRRQLTQALPEATFTGTLDAHAVADTLASADIFLFPSRTDTLGNVVLEAQASGLPVLVSDAGGPRENMIDGETGFVCRDTKCEGFAARIAQLVGEPGLRRRCGEAARTYACTRTWGTALQPLYQAWRDTAARLPVSLVAGGTREVREA